MRSHLLPIIFLTFAARAQEAPLDSVIAWAQRHQRFETSRATTADIGAMQQRESANVWYPQLVLNAQSTVQNEQFGLPFSLPGTSIPEVPLDFHRVLLNFSQTIYEGETTRARKLLDALNTSQQDLAFAGRALDVRAQVTQRYMAVLLAEAQLRLLDLRKNTLEQQKDRITVAVEAGSALASEENSLEAEWLSADQEAVQVRHTVERLREELAIISGDDRPRASAFVTPTDGDPAEGNVEQRPDVRAYDLRLQALDAQSDLALAARMPKLKFFGNAGAGDPGYNSFRDEWRPMLLAGLGLEWRILDWGSRKRTDRTIDLQRTLVQQDRDRLAEQWNIALSAQRRNLVQYRELMISDDRLVALRAQVAAAKAEQLANGTITASDYITELNKEHAARLGREIHALQAVQAIRTYQDIQAR